jgi:hypothetical protein
MQTDERNADIQIGIAGVSSFTMDKYAKLSKIPFKNDVFTDYDIIRFTTGVFHEVNHIYQYNILMQEDSDRARVHTYSDLLTYNNYAIEYYRMSENYYYNPCEIMAEYNGLMDSYKYLSLTFPNEDWKSKFADYVNSNIKYGCISDGYFIHQISGRIPLLL